MWFNPRAALLAVSLALVAGPAVAQVDTTKPIVVKEHKPSTKLLKFKGTVVNATIAAITVRNQSNPMDLVTFSYTTDVRAKILKIIENGGYHFGDKVTIEYSPGTTIAIKIHGKPSKPS